MNPSIHSFCCSSLTRAALDASSQAHLVTNAAGYILFSNRNIQNWFGYSNSEIFGRSLTRMVPEVDIRDIDAQHMADVSQVAPESLKDGMRRVIRKDGSEIFANVSFVEVDEQNQKLILANFSCTEVNLPGAMKLESERLDAIAQMISGLAHESRNALQRAVACLDLLELDLSENVKQMELSGKIRRSLSDLLNNYDEVRRFAQPLNLSSTRLSLCSICSDAFREMDELVPDSCNELSLVRDRDFDDEAFLDSDKIHDVFRLVFENALEKGRGDAKITVEWRDAHLVGGSAIGISIRDDGEPFSAESLARAFEPFYTTKQHGTGLGLSISRRIVQAHGGIIRVSNPVSGGAEVEIILPRHGVKRAF